MMQMFFRKKTTTRTDRVKKKSVSPKMVLMRQIVFGALLFLLVGLLLVGVWYGSRIDRLTLKTVEVIGGETIDHEALKVIVFEELQGEYYRLVPRAFAWTYPHDTIVERIKQTDRLKHVHIERAGEKLIVVFEEYVPFALWCKAVEADDCLFMDREGLGFSVAPKLQGGAFLRFSEVGRVPVRFETGFPGEYIRETDAFIKQVYDTFGMNITHVDRTGEEELVYFVAGGGKLKVSRRQSVDETLNNLTTLLTSDAFSHIEPGNFQYIDLRYGNKLFVNEEDPHAARATSTATSTVETP